jgi:lycopene beta-cyclase
VSRNSSTFDAVLVGGGLQNALIALALLDAQPRARIAIVERGGRLGGEHTWCFHADDVPDTARAFLDPLIEHRWNGYDVRFPGVERQLDSAYAGFTSARLHQHVSRVLDRAGCQLLTGTNAIAITAHRVALDTGVELTAPLVIDARGPELAPARGRAGYQKFLGRELQCTAPHGLLRPVVMDATVPQQDGFRFFYLLPTGADRLLVEDTCFADTTTLDRPALRSGIDAYVAARGMSVARVLREEEGVLPMPWTGSGPVGLAAAASGSGPLLGGYRGGWLHPATGYSLTIALRLALALAQVPPGKPWQPPVAALARELRRQVRFAQLLNRLLFRWFLPADRSAVFRRFYTMPEATIRRFYALRTTFGDRLRMLGGRPPAGLSLRARLSVVERFA